MNCFSLLTHWAQKLNWIFFCKSCLWSVHRFLGIYARENPLIGSHIHKVIHGIVGLEKHMILYIMYSCKFSQFIFIDLVSLFAYFFRTSFDSVMMNESLFIRLIKKFHCHFSCSCQLSLHMLAINKPTN